MVEKARKVDGNARHVLTHDNFKKMPVIWDLYGAIMDPFLNTFQQKTKKSVGKIFF